MSTTREILREKQKLRGRQSAVAPCLAVTGIYVKTVQATRGRMFHREAYYCLLHSFGGTHVPPMQISKALFLKLLQAGAKQIQAVE